MEPVAGRNREGESIVVERGHLYVPEDRGKTGLMTHLHECDEPGPECLDFPERSGGGDDGDIGRLGGG